MHQSRAHRIVHKPGSDFICEVFDPNLTICRAAACERIWWIDHRRCKISSIVTTTIRVGVLYRSLVRESLPPHANTRIEKGNSPRRKRLLYTSSYQVLRSRRRSFHREVRSEDGQRGVLLACTGLHEKRVGIRPHVLQCRWKRLHHSPGYNRGRRCRNSPKSKV